MRAAEGATITKTLEGTMAGISEQRDLGRDWRPGFWSLILTQFQGAFSENAYKFLLIFLLTASELSKARRDDLVLLVSALFSFPFILFSMAGGFLADRFSKARVTLWTKAGEVIVTTLGLVGLVYDIQFLKLAVVFLLSTQAAFFGPSKYGLLPELLPQKRLSWGNGIIELGTFLAIITGTTAGGAMAGRFHDKPLIAGVILVALAVTGLICSLGIGRVPAADPKKSFRFNFLSDLFSQIRSMSQDRVLGLAVVGNTYVWFLAALLQINIIFYGTDVLHLSESQNGYLQAAVALGIGVGSFVAGYLSGNKIEVGLIPLGSLGISVFGMLLFRPHLGLGAVAAILALTGFFAGFFVVPVNALIQHRPAAKEKGGVIAAANLLSFIGVFFASGVYYLLTKVFGLDAPRIFLFGAVMTLASTAYALVLQPDAFLRLLLWFFTRSVYRIRVVGRENIPAKGGALFVCNHLSFVDVLLLMSSTERRIRFLIFQDIYDRLLIKPFARIMQAIPISSTQRPRDLIRSLREASGAIKSGRVVGIFAEGQISRVGQMLPFRRGLERIMKGVEAPIIPVNLDGVWGSIFSFSNRRFFWKLPRRIPYPVTVTFGRPMPAESTAVAVRAAVQELQSEAYALRKGRMKTLHRRMLSSMRHNPFRFLLADSRTPKMRAGSALTRTVLLARRLRGFWQGQEMIGILLPPSVAASLVNLAALLSGKIPVNLNYTVTGDSLASCARQCRLQTIVTSREFLEKVPIPLPATPLFLEDLAARPRFLEVIRAILPAWMYPARLLEKSLGAGKISLDDTATIIFSSGSTGDPKGVMLTHYNIGSNVDQLGQTFALAPRDRILGILPLFHSFGFTGTFALPLVSKVPVVYHANPLDARVIGALVGRYAVTLLVATPTFLQAYMRRCAPEDFGSLDYVLVGAEKLHEAVAQAFEDKFGVRPLEAYGCTECAPAVTVNTRDYRAAGFRQVGAKRGKIGHPLPGISVRVVDPETRAALPIGTPGLLLVRGPNVMKGYLGKPEKTAEVLSNGWYDTGDIAMQDEDGFLSITDRLSRFSKIGGEMVPHGKIEEKLNEISQSAETCFAVTSVPDDRKGERLVVLHTLGEERLQECIDQLNHSNLPNLWLPRGNAFCRVEALPYLGTGKLDLRKMRERAAEFVRQGGGEKATKASES
jgi:acyl-[acyl-carrier-protein]-phospholipid O-acyltransferase / long-chain-fatty-acid--[acyl-carrier-protein] ligase